ncbi:hypothetical protein MGMO_96c00090 [Methyloglobulus morosus KoM1]|uniref:Uncharacterized protein n=1 Tax=Methyloglobulus morosus KoM1 TaxID=1116472 RepID=V5BZB1_9GAMM|nr:hypothetical protein [Methyloglobulus morosus]ESS71562.1 hypothetical protein MGMO_96c00090 [Methyloglobulus morosus KoM1]
MTTLNQFLVPLLLLGMYAANAYGDEHSTKPCLPYSTKLSDLKLQQPPRHVLLVPLLSGDQDIDENPRWPEQPARALGAFYRNRFGMHVKQLRDVWSWSDYFQQVEQLVQQGASFDRIVFISHGGYDGPILKNAMYVQEHKITGSTGELLFLSEAQPGLKNELTITYDTEKNRLFNDYMAAHWKDLASMEFDAIWQQLTGLEKQIQPLDNLCYQRNCSAERLALRPTEQRDYQRHLCELICRKSLFKIKKSVEVSTERFFHFITSLNSLLIADGLIFFGACNPGSVAPVKGVQKDETELLINSTLAGGPHMSYVHLVSDASGHIVSGPVGESSGEDVVKRIIQFESNRPQHHLCIVLPTIK